MKKYIYFFFGLEQLIYYGFIYFLLLILPVRLKSFNFLIPYRYLHLSYFHYIVCYIFVTIMYELRLT